MSPEFPKSAAVPVRPLAENRRRGQRHALEIPATLVLEGGPSRQVRAVITELSVAGVGMRCDEALPAGTTAEVRAYDSLVPSGMRVKVISHRAASGGFELGAEALPPIARSQ